MQRGLEKHLTRPTTSLRSKFKIYVATPEENGEESYRDSETPHKPEMKTGDKQFVETKTKGTNAV